MHMPMVPLGQPGPHFRGLVGRLVVHDQLDVQIIRNRRLNLAKELQELGGAVAGITFADHLAGGDVQYGEERCRTMARRACPVFQ